MKLFNKVRTSSEQYPNRRDYRNLVFIFMGLLVIITAVVSTSLLNHQKPSTFTELLDETMRGTAIESISILEYSYSTPPHKHNMFTTDKETIGHIINLLTDLQLQGDSNAASNTIKAEYNISIGNSDGLMLGMVLSDGGLLDTYDFVTSKSAGRFLVLNEFNYDAIEHLLEQESQ